MRSRKIKLSASESGNYTERVNYTHTDVENGLISLQSFQYISVDCTTPEIRPCGWWALLLREAKIVMCQKFVIM